MQTDLKQLLSQGVDEAVSVNQRALIEKILARYSGEQTVFRELLQNSDDAGACHVEIHFRTTVDPASATTLHSSDQVTGGLPNLKKHKLAQIVVRNDGQVFRDEDWMRLKKIAEGNPDESKIGAFGVGFYSLFSICDEPLVSSGEKVMLFFWKDGGDQLYVKTAVDPNGLNHYSSEGHPWSTFAMDLREPEPMPDPLVFARFLTTCLAFTTKIRHVSMHFDGHVLFRVTKALAPSRPIPLRSNLAATSPLKILHLTRIDEAPVQLKVDISRWLLCYAVQPKAPTPSFASAPAAAASSFASKMLAAFTSKSSAAPAPALVPTASSSVATPIQDPFTLLAVSLFLRTVSSTLRVTPTRQFSTEMLRATKKGLPSTTVYSLIWTGKDEFDASQAGKEAVATTEEKNARQVFAGLLSNLESSGRVFIGFPTFQTTGCASSIAARFVSTVERESLDFQAKYVADWNRELLAMGGVLARTVFEEEMSEIARLYTAKIDDEQKKRLQERALHLMRFFTYTPSTPQEIVSTLTEAAFFQSNANTSITLISQLGPTSASKVRLPNPALTFIKGIPVVPELVSSGAPRVMGILREKGLVKDISLEDILNDLASHPLTIAEASDAFRWWLSLAANRSYSPSLLARLKDSAMLSLSDRTTEEERILPLSAFQTYLNPQTITPDLPLPDHTLPFELTRRFQGADLARVFEFTELTSLDWARHVVSPACTGAKISAETNVLVSPPFAEKFLMTISRGWSTLSTSRQHELSTLMAPLRFMPTRQGQKLASESYFPSVVLFEDLPIVTLPSGTAVKGALEKVLLALGVRRHVELQLVFTRLLGAEGGWSHVDVVRYLVSVSATLTANELDRLRKTAWLPQEGEAPIISAPDAEGQIGNSKTVRHMAATLYEPTEAHRRLGLPLLDWTKSLMKWRSSSEEAKLMFSLGLLKAPAIDELLEIAANSEDASRQRAAFEYFLEQYATAGFAATYLPSKHALPFVPAIKDGKKIFGKPHDVYSNVDCACLGFAVLDEQYQHEAAKLKVARDPPARDLVSAILLSPPKTLEKARQTFAYLSSCVSNFGSEELSTLERANIIPVGGKIVSPSTCFFETEQALPPGLKALFIVIPDFGLNARPFLVAIGVKASPSINEIAAMLIADPDRFLELSGSSERYLSLLRMVAASFQSLPFTLKSRARMSAFFLGTKRVATGSHGGPNQPTLLDDESDDEDGGGGGSALTYQLTRASDLAINDDPQSLRVFQADVWSCPQEDALEALAEGLGASRISKLVAEGYRSSGEANPNSKRAHELHGIVVERTFLFLSERKQQYGKGELRHDPDWIQSGGGKHLQVIEVRSIELVRTLSVGRTTKRHSQAASAFAKASSQGDLLLYIAGDVELDYYEVATALCRLLLSKQRANDTLLYMTILSTPLKALRRRGFNVDRIVNARKAEREAADLRMREARARAQLDAARTAEEVNQLEHLFPDADPAFLSQLLLQQAPPKVENAVNALLTSSGYPRRSDSKERGTLAPNPGTGMGANGPAAQNSLAALTQQALGDSGSPDRSPSPAPSSSPSIPSSADKGLFSKMRSSLSRSNVNNGAGSIASVPRSSSSSSLTGDQPPRLPRPSTSGTSTAGSTPSSTDAIRSNVRKAIQASRPEHGSSVSNGIDKTSVKESEQSYCDATAGTNLVSMGDVAGLKFFIDRTVAGPRTFVRDHVHSIDRFIRLIVLPVSEVLTLDYRALHIFFDSTGPLIAFNRNGSIYLNLRYYEAWYDSQVQQGQLHDALISTYHTLAHEVAHNLVKPHNSEHEFYFSSICEEYFLRMAQLLGRVEQEQQRRE
ncbi:hypothetical protein MVLG_01317 [Microbotryum lychnidis-dioicae p1A1 Lamole]|uniref:Sacsin/Nov domain-containing protein n=1 Tax=Microbotryum lychnidis-dioicae (strain p1A1 Lamole / MvSl-1064) TaxID=683840 RepID=U5H1R6_USTV1|nr:hypothetical protein MVLG_01317 [Microbotryum lychnidis-dioicae p1A1 Lamole]|eukprot:KDE08540.1 hypothetical protein MVLG_01317 [Microbotryum lychnidis-dioicae p1A1 Lamole]